MVRKPSRLSRLKMPIDVDDALAGALQVDPPVEPKKKRKKRAKKKRKK